MIKSTFTVVACIFAAICFVVGAPNQPSDGEEGGGSAGGNENAQLASGASSSSTSRDARHNAEKPQVPRFTLTPFVNEEPCAREGGLCVEQEYCPETALADRSAEGHFLCPGQRTRGAACCYGLPKKPLPCGMRGGSCRATCGRVLQADPLGICPDPTGEGGDEGDKCCPLLI